MRVFRAAEKDVLVVEKAAEKDDLAVAKAAASFIAGIFRQTLLVIDIKNTVSNTPTIFSANTRKKNIEILFRTHYQPSV